MTSTIATQELPVDHIHSATAYVFPHAAVSRTELDFELQLDDAVIDEDSAAKVAESITRQVHAYLGLSEKYHDGDEAELKAILIRLLATADRQRAGRL